MTSRIRSNGIGIPSIGDRYRRMTVTADHCEFCDAHLAQVIKGKKYSRRIGVTDTARDRVGWWRCPDCGAEVER